VSHEGADRTEAELAQAVVDFVPHATVVVRAGPGGALVVELANRAAGGAGLVGRSLADLWPQEIADRLLECCREAVATGSASGRLSMERAYGGPWLLEARVFAMPGGRLAVTWDSPSPVVDGGAESEALLRRAIEGVDAVVVVWDRPTGAIRYSDQVSRILGHDATALSTFAAYESLIHPDDLAGCIATWRGSDEAWTMEYRFRRGDGEWIWVRDSGLRRRGPGGWDRLYAVLTDVTAIREADAAREAAILARERLYRELIERSDAITWASSGLGTGNVYMSPQVRDILGHDPELWRDPTFWESTVHPDDLQHVLASIRSSDNAEFEYRAIAADGRTVWFLERIRVLRDTDGREVRRIGISIDITARKEAEAWLRASEERFRSLVDELDAVVFAVETDGSIWASQQAETILGRPPAELATGAAWREIVVEDDRERVYAAWDSRTSDRHELEFRVRRPSGETAWVSEHLRAVRDAGGTPIRWYGLLVDITERRHLRERLLRRARMEDVGRLAAAAAHDFDNVLFGIGLHARVLAEGETSPERAADLDRIIEAAERGNALVRQLLDVGRSSDAPAAPVDLVALVRRIDALLARLAGPGVTVRVRAPDTPVRAAIDPGTVEQILCNLVLNARDAMPDGGRLTIEVDRADLDPGARPGGGPHARIAVHDTGTGMTPDVAAHAFEPFFTTKLQGEGSGLGLASVRHLVRAARGEVDLHTGPGSGTTVELLLPLARQSE
jgi:PAS domain S-box-containing protein